MDSYVFLGLSALHCILCPTFLSQSIFNPTCILASIYFRQVLEYSAVLSGFDALYPAKANVVQSHRLFVSE